MKNIGQIVIILFLITSLPVWAGQVYTNSSLKKYDSYKSRSKVKKGTPENVSGTDATTEISKKQNNIEILEQKMSWGKTNDDGNDKNYHWQVKLVNTFTVSKEVGIEFNLIDKEGNILSVANGTGKIETNKTEIFTGAGTIKSDVAARAVRTSVTLTAK
jgi:hypothetical protein